MKDTMADRHVLAIWRTCIVILMCCSLSACLGFRQPGHAVHHYTFEYGPPAAAGLEKLPLSLRIERFTAAPACNTTGLVYRDASFRREEYVYHKWRAYPSDLVAGFFGRDLQQAGFLDGVFLYGSSFSAPYALEGSVDEIFAWESDKAWEAVLGVTITLLARNEQDVTKKILLQKSYASRKPCEHKTPQSLAAAMSGAMADISGAAMRDIYRSLKSAAARNPDK